MRQWKRAMKFGLLIIVLIVCIGGSGCAAKRDAQPPPTVAGLAAVYAESGLDVSEAQIKAELLRLERAGR